MFMKEFNICICLVDTKPQILIVKNKRITEKSNAKRIIGHYIIHHKLSLLLMWNYIKQAIQSYTIRKIKQCFQKSLFHPHRALKRDIVQTCVM